MNKAFLLLLPAALSLLASPVLAAEPEVKPSVKRSITGRSKTKTPESQPGDRKVKMARPASRIPPGREMARPASRKSSGGEMAKPIQIKNGGLLKRNLTVAAYALFWLLPFIYLFLRGRRHRQLSNQISRLQDEMDHQLPDRNRPDY